jgi:hypothetical protein
MTLPPLIDWEPTRNSLHRAAQIIGALRRARVARQPNALHLALFPTTAGLETGPLDDGASVALTFADRMIRVRSATGDVFSLSLDGLTPRAALTKAAAALSLDPAMLAQPDDPDAPLAFDPAHAAAYAGVLNTVYVGLARWRARLLGPMTPLVVWPHGFDLSGLWFAGEAADEAHEPHVNLGFSPASPGFPRPYLYTYARPWPDGAETHPLPGAARWHDGEWAGAVLDYDALSQEPDPVHMITGFAAASFRILASYAP